MNRIFEKIAEDIHGNVDTLIQDYGSSLVGLNMMNNNGLHNRFKRMVYKYDSISGKVNHVAYQPQYIKGNYLYRPSDAENRITGLYPASTNIPLPIIIFRWIKIILF